ncbi:MAG: DUF3883 domain-containing protein [Proteobacteria bacterium]|nr:DUF3883 domain-containing protein [Pseudomonadota bacterium]
MIDRSRGAIERKHQNISAVLVALGLPRIKGYIPLANYQKALFDAIEARIDQTDIQDRMADVNVVRDAPPQMLVYTPPPPMSARPYAANPQLNRLVRKFDPAWRDARARALGEAGEAFLYQAEQDRLSDLGRDDLAGKVRWVAKEDGDGAGYDILSFSRRGEERWLEVKTTNGPATTPFWITANERRVSEQRPDVFRLARLYDFSRTPTAFRLKPPLTDHVRLAASQYRATF